jgi:hypothetical protein
MDTTGNVGEAYRAITDQPEAEPVKLKRLTPLEQVLALIPKLSLQQNWAVTDALSMHRDSIKRGELVE